jgi:hypothetical protein
MIATDMIDTSVTATRNTKFPGNLLKRGATGICLARCPGCPTRVELVHG